MGEVFAGRYELLDPIASGGMGTVWRVLDRTAGEVKAAKMLRQTDAAMLLRFVREQSVRIDHTHVVTPQSWAGVDDRVLFTMPLVRGGSVAGLVKRHGGTLPPRWVAALGDQTLQALEAVHAAGIVHRDIKPGNLLLEPTGTGRPHLRLTDFGIAVPADEPRLTHTPMVIGTPGYMPPEQVAGADPDPSADVFALGVVLLEMLTGNRPPADTPHAPVQVAPLRTGNPEHDALLEVVAAATTYDAGQRPSAAELRAHPALQSLVQRWDDPALADGVSVHDDYPATTELSPVDLTPAPPPPPAGPQVAYPPPPPPVAALAGGQMTMAPTAGPTRVDTPPGGPSYWSGPASGHTSGHTSGRATEPAKAPLDAWLLIGVGVIGVLLAVFLLVG